MLPRQRSRPSGRASRLFYWPADERRLPPVRGSAGGEGAPNGSSNASAHWAQQLGIRPLVAFLAPLNNRILAAVVAFGFNSGAYSTEIIRSAIAAIPPEQMEAAQSLGMSYWLAMRRIIIPQSARVAFPPLGNEFIAVIKGTSLASVIGVTELMRHAQLVAAATFQNLAAYTLAAVFYVVLVIILQSGVSLIERRFSLTHK